MLPWYPVTQAASENHLLTKMSNLNSLNSKAEKESTKITKENGSTNQEKQMTNNTSKCPLMKSEACSLAETIEKWDILNQPGLTLHTGKKYFTNSIANKKIKNCNSKT